MDDSKFPDLMRPSWVSDQYTDKYLSELKQKGNAYFKNGDFESAMPYYLAILHRTKHMNHNSTLIIDSYNNIALIYFKIKQYYQCIDKCNIVLSMDPNQDKAIFRRNKCHSIIQKKKFNQDQKQTNKWNEYPLIHRKELKQMGIAESPLYEVRKVPFHLNKIGFFASKNIKTGTIIFRERPLFILKKHANDSITFTRNGGIQHVSDREKTLNAALNRLNKQQRDIFTMMRASDIEMSDHYNNIYLTNNIILNDEYGAIFATASRLNHCCIANVHGIFNKNTSKYCVVAVKDIKKGEQICTSFISSIPEERADRRDELLKLYGFICECKYCNFETFNKYEAFTKEFAVLRQRLLNIMSNQQTLLNQDPFEIVKRILYIFEHYYDSNAYYMDDYTEHAFLCALVKNDFKNLVRYAALHTYWNNLKCGYIVDNGKKQVEYKFKIPEIIQSKKLHEMLHKAVDLVILDKKIPQFLYESPFAE